MCGEANEDIIGHTTFPALAICAVVGRGNFLFQTASRGGMLKEGMYQEESPKPTVLSPRPLSGILRQHPLPEA